VPTLRGLKPAALNLTCLATLFAVLFQLFSQWEMEGSDLHTVVQRIATAPAQNYCGVSQVVT